MEIKNVLEHLSKERPIFHSEADFQHALAWKIHEEQPKWSIRLEYPFEVELTRNKKELCHVDIFVGNDQKKYAIELKYKTKPLNIKINNEEFRLRDHQEGGGRRSFLEDLQRLEYLVKDNKKVSKAYNIFLTNNNMFWEPSKRKKETFDEEFRIHERRIIKNGEELNWGENISKKILKVGNTP